MAKIAARGTKRRCQDEACALPFYDLNRVEFSCPNCGAAYDMHLAPSQAVASQPASARYSRISPAATAKPEPVTDSSQRPEDDEEEGDAGAAETLIEDDDEEGNVDVPRSGGISE